MSEHYVQNPESIWQVLDRFTSDNYPTGGPIITRGSFNARNADAFTLASWAVTELQKIRKGSEHGIPNRSGSEAQE